jgi:uncharacterized membrane protein (DUF4010 family)
MLVAFLLGVLSMSKPVLGAGLGVVVAVVLASKSRVHRFTREVLTEAELHDGLLLAACALVVLPLLPDESVDPWGALNLRALWRLVVLVMAINAAGYVGLRALGPKHGLALAGFTGGFVSSTATIAGMGNRARAARKLLGPCVTGALLSNIATVVQLAIVLGLVAPALLLNLAPALAASGAVALVYAGVFGWRDLETAAPKSDAAEGRPFQATHALAFAALVAVILLCGAWVHRWLGDAGIVIAGAVGGLADVHAASSSVGQLVGHDEQALHVGSIAVLAAFASNSLSKTVAAFAGGGAAFGWRVLPGLVAIAGAFAAGVFLL